MLRSPNTDSVISSNILPQTSGVGWHGILLNRRKNGEEFPVELSTSIIQDEQGNTLAMIGVAQDITERRKAEERLLTANMGLVNALVEIRKLSGLLPICAYCKKIRDDKGYWNQLEAYIGQHTDATFTHGICPDCVKKIWMEGNKE
jgi:hypothetical protein